jgi:hypothetical protein
MDNLDAKRNDIGCRRLDSLDVQQRRRLRFGSWRSMEAVAKFMSVLPNKKGLGCGQEALRRWETWFITLERWRLALPGARARRLRRGGD